jgi:hypothetical protein
VKRRKRRTWKRTVTSNIHEINQDRFLVRFIAVVNVVIAETGYKSLIEPAPPGGHNPWSKPDVPDKPPERTTG